MSTSEQKIIENLLILLVGELRKKKVPAKKKEEISHRAKSKNQHSTRLKLILPQSNGRQLKLKSSSITFRVTVGW